MHPKTDSNRKAFDHLTPDLVIHLTEEALGSRCTNLCRPLNSYINRVYEVQPADGDPVIAKFYRPGRWSPEALADEQTYLFDLKDAEVPVIPPIGSDPEDALHEYQGMYFALFPKKGGRICDEPSSDEWKELGRLIGRAHLVGRIRAAPQRIVMHPEHSTEAQVAEIVDSEHMAHEWAGPYEESALATIEQIAPLFDDIEPLRIHGDLHHQNIIHRPGESFYLIDFDDMAMGPAVQDVWMLLPGRVRDARRELDLFLDGYETFREFEHAQLRLIEPLRAMRFIHYTAWCVRQAHDGGFARLDSDWGSTAYWRREVDELEKQRTEIEDALAGR